MKNCFLAPIVLSLGVLSAVAAPVDLTFDDFNQGTATGSVVAGTNWEGQVQQTPSTIVVTGGENNGWGATGVLINATGYNFIAVTASVDANNQAGAFTVRFSDDFLESEVFSTPTGEFTSSISTVYIPISWTSSIDISNITSWSIGGGNVGSTPFRMTFDNISLVAAIPAPVPEPSTYAMIAGFLVFGIVAWRRRVARA